MVGLNFGHRRPDTILWASSLFITPVLPVGGIFSGCAAKPCIPCIAKHFATGPGWSGAFVGSVCLFCA